MKAVKTDLTITFELTKIQAYVKGINENNKHEE